MARPWRLRPKLNLLLALGVGVVALFVGVAKFGLTSSSDTQATTSRKLAEMRLAMQLLTDVQRVRSSDGPAAGINSEATRVRARITAAQDSLRACQEALRAHYPSGTDGSLHDYAALARLPQRLGDLGETLDKALATPGATPVNDPRFVAGHQECERLAAEFFTSLTDDVQHSNEQNTANHLLSMRVSWFAAAFAVVLGGVLVHSAHAWVLSPIRQIQAGVAEVHAGHFDRPILLRSGDELQELADEFNAMVAHRQEQEREERERSARNAHELQSQVNEGVKRSVLSERMVSTGFLAAGVAHEINNPLASVAFCAEAIERRLQPVLPRLGSEGEVVQKYLRMIQDESQRCKTITQKLLDFSRSGGKRERAELSQLVADVIEVARVLPNARNKTVHFAPEATAVAAVSVPDVKGVVLNLIVNALDSMEEGGGLDVTLVSDAAHAELRFRDTGCGMAADTLRHIFEPFFTRSRTGNGTGLGLSISHQIIDQHGGTIRAESAGPGQGSTFVVRLPLAAAAEGTDAAAPPEFLPFPGRVAAVA